MNHKPGSVTVKPQVLLFTAIYLGLILRSSSLQSTRSTRRAALLLFDFAPDGVYSFRQRYRCRGGLLPRHFTLTQRLFL